MRSTAHIVLDIIAMDVVQAILIVQREHLVLTIIVLAVIAQRERFLPEALRHALIGEMRNTSLYLQQ